MQLNEPLDFTSYIVRQFVDVMLCADGVLLVRFIHAHSGLFYIFIKF